MNICAQCSKSIGPGYLCDECKSKHAERPQCCPVCGETQTDPSNTHFASNGSGYVTFACHLGYIAWNDAPEEWEQTGHCWRAVKVVTSLRAENEALRARVAELEDITNSTLPHLYSHQNLSGNVDLVIAAIHQYMNAKYPKGKD